MAVLPIARMGNPVLRRIADPVADPTDPAVVRLAADMIATMLDAPGVGLAAPQVSESRRIIVFRVPADRSGGEEVANTVLVNPVIEPLSDETVLGWEGCLSIPGLRGLVPRHNRIRYRGFGLDGSRIEREASGFHARVVQHEVDHLDGVLYLDRMDDLRLLVCTEEMHHLNAALAAAKDAPAEA
ncbi:peptide deformylase [Azospirillum picis]|uniref:Peptide deformylase n=1 Tax=Azospirillum picis TaxID=488438 RepID=A0ABU0ME53_9PROT|nr:peptide deformylase [Azospirillum picis]MBP2297873.1 peptide deformylase [Azospirillum picis]MDQ0531711.1 peptide deformylase [Azospirillum picis]